MRALLCLLLFIPIIGWSQIQDDFSDGNFSQNPEWTGDVSLFKINSSFQLQLNQLNPRTDLADTSYLATFLGINDSLQWMFDIRLGFSPSDNNNARVYLLSDQNNIKLPLTGYYLQFGEAGGEDALELFYQNGTTTQSVCRGTNGTVAAAFDSKIKVTYKQGLWTVYADWNKTGTYQQECSGQSQNTISNPYFGFFCKYTSSNATKFYFDNIDVNYIYQDQTPAELVSAELVSPTEVKIFFNESITTESAENTANYTLSPNQTHPSQAVQNTQNPAEVLLTFSEDFYMNDELNITAENISDLAGNIQTSTSASFIYSRAQYGEISINEIMADPTPVVGLPDAEYLEIYNHSTHHMDLNNWVLKIGDTEKVFPNITLNDGEYLILGSTSNTSLLSPYGTTLGFDSFVLTNGGQSLTLIDNYGQIIDEVSYSDTWYTDSAKSEGGWSLEKIDPFNACLGQDNWTASINTTGGTPGTQNSVFSDTFVMPEVSSFSVISDSSLRIVFNQKMNEQDLLFTENYTVNEGVGNPATIQIIDDNRTVELVFNTHFALGTAYQLSLSSGFSNCVWQSLSGNVVFDFELPKEADFGDVIINEIMADPTPVQELPDAEYLELYNQTPYPILLNGWTLYYGSSRFVFTDYTLPANGYLLLTHPDKVAALSAYGNVLPLTSFGLSNAGATLVIKNQNQQIIHYIAYDDTWYNDDFKAEGGWSLEMISHDYFCEQKINWSASEDSRGGTPGSANSLSSLQPDYQLPYLKSIEVLSTNDLKLSFSKNMDSTALANTQNYSVDNGIGSPASIQITAPDYTLAQLHFNSSFSESEWYTLSMETDLTDCGGSSLENDTKQFAIPQQAESGDIVINEVLFDAALSNGEYVELYNRSNKVIDTRKLLFSRVLINTPDTTLYSLQPDAGQLFPEEYLLLCENKEAVLAIYQAGNPNQIYANSDFPLLPNTEGNLQLTLAANPHIIIDAFSYSEDMQDPLMSNTQGVALERLSPDEATNDANNWQSASSSVNYGTPTYQNSQYQPQQIAEDVFEITPEIFSPDLDGFDDVLNINYRFSESGYTLNLLIYNARGQQVKHLVKNEWMGAEGQIFWDGTTDTNEKAPMGIYILYFEYFDLNGKVEHAKKTCVLGGKL